MNIDDMIMCQPDSGEMALEVCLGPGCFRFSLQALRQGLPLQHQTNPVKTTCR